MGVALVTGASSGIGAAIAIAFADVGWQVMAAGRDEIRLAEVADASENISTWAGELAESEDCDELVADTVEEFGAIDSLINCAGIFVRRDVSETSDDDWRDTMSVNLDVTFFLSRAALPHLLSAEGSIVNIASDWGIRGGEKAAAYCASKGGVILLTRAMARDHALDGLRINAVCPGDVDTPMLVRDAVEQELEVDEYLARLADESPNGRLAEPADIAAISLFLASESARHINGAVIPVDGGASA